METWLLTGGAGYIGGHVIRALRGRGHRVVVLDLPEASASAAGAARLPADVPVVRASVLDGAAVERALVEHAVDGVVHLAARKSVGESVERPAFYYRENVDGTLAVVEAMTAAGVRRIVYSSSAAVYGTPPTDVVAEEAPTAPLNPYGRSKLAAEWVVQDAALALGWGAVSLRYFNVVGTADPALADSSGSNLFPRVLAALAAGEPPVVNGTDYPTRDGSCVRDYIHVADLADAHLAAVEATARPRFEVVNVGRGEGYSVLEVLAEFERAAGRPIERTLGPRRPGDPASVVASVDRARAVLGWTARHGLDEMVASTWAASGLGSGLRQQG